jgi:hypothetical protein
MFMILKKKEGNFNNISNLVNYYLKNKPNKDITINKLYYDN